MENINNVSGDGIYLKAILSTLDVPSSKWFVSKIYIFIRTMIKYWHVCHLKFLVNKEERQCSPVAWRTQEGCGLAVTLDCAFQAWHFSWFQPFPFPSTATANVRTPNCWLDYVQRQLLINQPTFWSLPLVPLLDPIVWGPHMPKHSTPVIGTIVGLPLHIAWIKLLQSSTVN